ncbi:hypothetical protein MAHJHV55_42990 [Mycobacterium avium subsp. hominissuis]
MLASTEGLPGPLMLNRFGRPGSPSVLANMVLHAEVQVDWVIDLLCAGADWG